MAATFPQSDDKLIRKLSSILKSYIEGEGVEFCIQDNDLYVDEVVGHFGCLPLILYKAHETYQEIYNKDFPIKFINYTDGYFNVEPLADGIEDQSFTILAHFSMYSVEEYIRQYKQKKQLLVNGKIPLDPLYDNWNNALTQGKVKVSQSKVQQSM